MEHFKVNIYLRNKFSSPDCIMNIIFVSQFQVSNISSKRKIEAVGFSQTSVISIRLAGVTCRSQWPCGLRSAAVRLIVGSNPPGSMDVCLLCVLCVIR
jgi:hypothetical protein